jgi:hypothetical protein
VAPIEPYSITFGAVYDPGGNRTPACTIGIEAPANNDPTLHILGFGFYWP